MLNTVKKKWFASGGDANATQIRHWKCHNVRELTSKTKTLQSLRAQEKKRREQKKCIHHFVIITQSYYSIQPTAYQSKVFMVAIEFVRA